MVSNVIEHRVMLSFEIMEEGRLTVMIPLERMHGEVLCGAMAHNFGVDLFMGKHPFLTNDYIVMKLLER